MAGGSAGPARRLCVNCAQHLAWVQALLLWSLGPSPALGGSPPTSTCSSAPSTCARRRPAPHSPLLQHLGRRHRKPRALPGPVHPHLQVWRPGLAAGRPERVWRAGHGGHAVGAREARPLGEWRRPCVPAGGCCCLASLHLPAKSACRMGWITQQNWQQQQQQRAQAREQLTRRLTPHPALLCVCAGPEGGCRAARGGQLQCARLMACRTWRQLAPMAHRASQSCYSGGRWPTSPLPRLACATFSLCLFCCCPLHTHPV